MPELIAIHDGGETIEYRHGGHPEKRGVLIFRASVNEAKPADFYFTYPFYLKETLKKYFGKIRVWRPEIDTTQHRPAIDRDEFLAALEACNGFMDA